MENDQSEIFFKSEIFRLFRLSLLFSKALIIHTPTVLQVFAFIFNLNSSARRCEAQISKLLKKIHFVAISSEIRGTVPIYVLAVSRRL